MHRLSFVFATAFLVLAALPVRAAEPSLNPEQRREVEAIVKEYLRSNPEVILEAIQALQERDRAEKQQRQAEALARLRDTLERAPASPVAGNAEGDVTVVEFFDYRCGYCKSVFPTIRQLLKDDPKIRYVFKEFPILTPESHVAARAALAAWQQDADIYFAFHGRLMEAKGELDERRIIDLARQSGADIPRLKRDMASTDIERELDRNRQLAEALGIAGTPAFIIGERVVPGAIDLKAMKTLIAEARGQS